MPMSKDSLDHLRAVFGPEIWGLNVDQCAKVLGNSTRGAKGHIRERIKRGDFPRARKDGGRWKIPVEDVAEIIDPTPTPQPVPALPRSGGYTSKRRSILGERITFIRSAEFWSFVCVAIAWFPELEALNKATTEAREELFEWHAQQLRERLSARLEKAKRVSGRKPI
jgi:hypothetical protein